jgi:hypothetical protein
VISDPYWFELNVRSTPQKLSLSDARESIRSRLFHRGLSAVSCRTKFQLAVALWSSRFGTGSMSRSVCVFGSIRVAGMTLPGKQPGPPAVTLHAPARCGSLMNTSRPLTSRVCEKSPRRSSSVGIRYRRSGPGRWTCGASSE